ncbi:phosphotransferase family protein (plasmid) [Sphingomonas paeninsulae]|jgi:aminoglycoside phosphotransferase (APT) family kinase protein|uniref:Phosphotransferase family protein n=1 Tax=Sphingomonas paeninsulae TaxID=2319844 RepID=A0A494TJ11_SPHPE|nr:phosphotransferase family protein [Sphingomonas paeninsulae]AYJ85418.1 phosphotransferase family protein [Sphingomonas paeninsulae]
MNDTENLYNVERLTAWLDENIPSLGDGPLKAAKIHGGTSNVILSLNRGGETMVLRRPPAVPPPGSEKTVMREARVLTALNGTPVPHPVCRGSCSDTEVIGAPFYVMDMVEGWAATIIDEHIYHKAPFDKPPFEYGIAYAMVDGLVALANVDYKAVGLEGFGKPDNYLERQVDRWEGQLRSYKELYNYPGRDLPGYDLTRDWLRANMPSSFQAGIIHGDVGTPNALFADGPPARLNALIDWELSTIGDPLLDLASFTNAMRDEAAPGVLPSKRLYNSENWPTRQEMARYYAAGTGRDMADFDYYAILAMFKGGCILEYKVAQSAAGILSKETGVFFSRLVLESFANAEALIRRIG